MHLLDIISIKLGKHRENIFNVVDWLTTEHYHNFLINIKTMLEYYKRPMLSEKATQNPRTIAWFGLEETFKGQLT